MNFGSRRVSLDDKSPVRIGRSVRCDVTVPDDPHISGMHFSVACEAGRIFLKDLQSRNGTFVNGAKVSDSLQLHDGDVIVAGKTQFQLVVISEPTGTDTPSESNGDNYYLSAEGPLANPKYTEYDQTEPIVPQSDSLFVHPEAKQDSPSAQDYPRLSSGSFKDARRRAGLGSDFPGSRPLPLSDSSQLPTNPSVPQRSIEAPRSMQIRYETRKAPSGMTYFCPRNEAKPPTDVAEFIGHNRFLYAVVNFSRLQPQQKTTFYNEAIAAGGVQISNSLLLIAKQETASFYSLLRQAWGQDAMICMASQLNKTDFTSLVYKLNEQLASPSQLLNHLYSDSQFTSSGLFDGVSALLLEIERGARWVIFKNDSEIRTWRTLGLPCPPELVG
ncbi:FHA domain-containing protein [bacterium]|nr:FHA domain-containing protein [bacterium]